MRRRQICCMHGGYRGSGTTINWNTTIPQGVVSEIPPEPQQDPVNLPDIPTPITPTPPIKPDKKSYNIASIVGLTVSGIGAAAALGVGTHAFIKSRSGIIDEGSKVPSSSAEDYPILKLSGDDDEKEEFDPNDVEFNWG